MEVRPRYKQTEVGSIPEEWDCVTVQTLVDENILEKPLDGNHGNIHPKSRDFVDYGIPFVMANNFLDGQVDLLGCKFITKERAAKLQKGFSIAGDVLLTHKGTVGNTAIVPELSVDFIMLTPQVTYYRVKDENLLNNGFLRQYLDSQPFQSLFKSLAGGGTRAYLGIVKQLALPIIKPPINEQRAIARALSDVDALLGGLDRLIAKKRDLKQAAMQQLLTGQTRLPGFRGEWEVMRLGDVGTFLKGSGVTKDEAKSGDLPCIRYGEIYTHHNDCIRSFNSWISPEVAARATRLRQGDLLFAGSGETKEEIGKCVAFTDDCEAFAGGDIVILRLSGAHAMFMGYYCNTAPINVQKASKGQGDAVVHISAAALSSVVIKLPSLPEQSAIAAVLSDMDAELAALEARRDKTRALKQAMMQELLTGRTRLV